MGYKLGGSQESFNEVIKFLSAELGLDLKPNYTENPIQNYVMHTLADTTKINELGFEAKHSLEDGIKRII